LLKREARTCGGKSFEVDEASGKGEILLSGVQGDRKAGVTLAEREPIVVGGNLAIDPNGWRVTETESKRFRTVLSSTPVDNYKGASGPEKGTRSLQGETSEG
jgi:hypothetical protein